jgi:hypothetical protein
MGRTKKLLCAVAVCASAVVGVGASAAYAGEVKGPPGTPSSTNETGALDHAHSACAANGLNDLTPGEGQLNFQVQSYGVDVAGKGDPADPHDFNPGDACSPAGSPGRP